MPAVFRHPVTVNSDDIDPMGHVHNLRYLRWAEDAAIQHSTYQGWDLERYQSLNGAWVAREHRVQYQKPAFLGDRLDVLTWIANFRKIRSLRKYRIMRQNDVLVVGQTDWTYVGMSTGSPRRVPAEVMNAFDIVEDDEVL